MEKQESWTITVVAAGAGPPLTIRVRRWLKNALRSYGLRAVSCTLTESLDDPPRPRPSPPTPTRPQPTQPERV